VRIRRGEETVFERQVPYGRSFSAVEQAEPLVYANELLYAAIALNRDSFAAAYGVGCGPRWTIRFEKVS
jgi:hypothetical protein